MTVASADTTLELRYASVSPPGLATPFGFTVSRPGGFDEIVGDRLDVQVDARMEPGAQSSAPGSVGLVEDGVIIEQAEFTTRILP